MSGGDGVAAVVAEAVSGVAAGIAAVKSAAEGEQVEAFALPTRFSADTPELDRARRRGRPAGSVNKSTKEFREWILKRGEHPLQWMMRWAGHTPESLAQELRCSLLEAFDRLKALHAELAPYFAAKMVPVDDEGRPVPFMMMQFGQFGGAPSAGGRPPWDYLKTVDNQVLEASQSQVSHGQVSHAGEKPA